MFRSGEKRQGLAGAVLAAAALLAACGGSTSETVAREDWSRPDPTHIPYEVLAERLAAGPSDGDEVVDPGITLSGEVFAIGEAHPRTRDDRWGAFVADLCHGTDALVPVATANGWTVTLTGFHDSAPGSANETLPLDRAKEVIELLAEACALPAAAFTPVDGGLSPTDTREIAVAFTSPTPSTP